MRLVGGTNYSGRVEIEYEGIWGTICDRGFDINDAKVICRMKGFNTESIEIRLNGFYGNGNGRIFISDLLCTGDEPDISECNVGRRWNNTNTLCTNINDVAVQCSMYNVNVYFLYYQEIINIIMIHSRFVSQTHPYEYEMV
ncbi:hypothetical protein DPMN_024429 [Dreissena polymorpha]|uniref:SRCR domain-containing protein n=1 Tax=Dreissena polymorpha TaxID=45954 RepID=A0A9D4LPB5_DREPO|nr:hypothetical protein DPMN_024429 [Dreissena polymorpha]